MLDLTTLWPLIRPKLDAKLKSTEPVQLGHELAEAIRTNYPTPPDRATLARVLAVAAGELGV